MFMRDIDITFKNRLIHGTYHLPLFAWLVQLVAAAQAPLEELAQVAGT
jgi:hypothetical protein